MYQRGVYDAEHDELNPFYYQHYYHYRRGYDKARRQVRQADNNSTRTRTILLVAVLLVVSFAGYAFASSLLTPEKRDTDAVVALATPAPASPSPQPSPSPRPTPRATANPPAGNNGLGIGARARVGNLNGATLRARQAPGTTAPIQARIPEGSVVTIIDGPIEAEGYTWWLIDRDGAGGWSAERSQDGVVWLIPEE